MMNDLSLNPYWAIAAMVVAGMAMRTGGYWLMGYVALTPRVQRMLAALPGAIVMSIVIPLIHQGGVSSAFAIAGAAAVMTFVRSEFLAMAVGVALAAALRAVGI